MNKRNFQLNKTSMQKIQKDLKNRNLALPTLKSKETALRTEVKKAKNDLDSLNSKLDSFLLQESKNYKIWMEYPGLLKISDIKVDNKNIAGVKVPTLVNIDFEVKEHSLFSERAWVPAGTEVLKKLTNIRIQRDLKKKELDILHQARKKTTQKVNLYEKVQIPSFKEAIGKIKRFLEDEENLSRAGQKIIKSRKDAIENKISIHSTNGESK